MLSGPTSGTTVSTLVEHNFTDSFFSNYGDDDLKVSSENTKTSYQSKYLKTQEQVDEYNNFISKLFI